jgi:hypothetical protein
MADEPLENCVSDVGWELLPFTIFIESLWPKIHDRHSRRKRFVLPIQNPTRQTAAERAAT